MSKRTRKGLKIGCATAADALSRARSFLAEQGCAGYKHVATAEKESAWFVNFGGQCPIHRRDHKSNHWFVTVPKANNTCRFHCHDVSGAATDIASAWTIGVRNPLPEYHRMSGFEFPAIEHIRNIALAEEKRHAKNAWLACCNYINVYAVYLLDPGCVFIHTGKWHATMYEETEFEIGTHAGTLSTMWPIHHRTIFKSAKCDLDGDAVTVVDGVLHLPRKTQVWCELGLRADRKVRFASESTPKESRKSEKK